VVGQAKLMAASIPDNWVDGATGPRPEAVAAINVKYACAGWGSALTATAHDRGKRKQKYTTEGSGPCIIGVGSKC
jgi:hypothetical protein